MNYAALCHKPEALTGLGFWLSYECVRLYKHLDNYGVCFGLVCCFFFSRRELIYIFIWIMIPWWRSEPRGRQLEETEEKKSTGKAGRQNRSCHTAGWRSDRQGALGTSHFLWIKILPFRNFWMCFRTFGNLTEQWHYQKCHESCTVTSQTTIIVALFGRQMLTDLFCSGSVRKPLYLSCLNYVQYLDPLCSY